MPAGLLRHRGFLTLALLTALALPACGGGGGGPGPDGAGQGLVLVNFLQANQDNVPINRVLEFVFSEPVDPSTINSATMQIRQGDAFGLTASGEFDVDGSTVYFKPRLPTHCGADDAGFQPSTTYRVTVMGYPEEFCVRNGNGQPLEATITAEYRTRPESDPEYLEDQIPATPPAVTSIRPENSEAAVTVNELNEVVIGFTENLDPCSVSAATVFFHVYEAGDPGVNNAVPTGEPNEGNLTGFTPWDDQSPDDPYTWGSSTGGPLPDPQLIPADIILVQDFDRTEMILRPTFGRFPENALCVVDLTFGIRDFGGSPLAPTTFSFTTQNLPMQEGSMRVEFDRSIEDWPQADRTADIDTNRSAGLAQGWLLFAGDGDNGGNTDVTPAFPIFSPGFACDKRPNDGFKDHFAPDVNVTLNTGSSRVPDSCQNETDGSQAVVWEFATFRIKNGVIVTIAGENPAIILVQGEVLIEGGGVLRVRGENGAAGGGFNGSTTASNGGDGVAGGSDGGNGAARDDDYGKHGYAGYASADYNTPGEQGGLGSGHGNVSATGTQYYNVNGNGNSGAGGGAGHGLAGSDGQSTNPPGMTFVDETDGAGGDTYPDSSPEKLYTPSAGSGGGGAGFAGHTTYSYSYYYEAPGGAGGGGGGFIDITSQADIRVYGTIDASGGRGGNGGVGGYWSAGGGGGGSGGAIRLLTPANIDITNGTLSTAGGTGGSGSKAQYPPAENNRNNGGAGGSGYICMEDGDSTITGITTVAMTPAYGTDTCYVGEFDSTRFQGGGLEGEAISGYILVGPLTAVTFIPPEATDFLCAIPADAAIPPAGTSILIEAAGYPLNPDGTPDETVGDAFYTIGYFSYSGSPNEPSWNEGSNPPDVVVANAGTGINNLDGSGYLRFRLRFFLPSTIGATTPGPWMDYMDFRFTYDQ